MLGEQVLALELNKLALVFLDTVGSVDPSELH